MIVTARECHVCQMAVAGLRAADVREIKAASGLTPEVGLRVSFRSSSRSWVALNESGRAFTMFGVADMGFGYGSPWLLATDEIARHRKALLRFTREYLPQMSHGYRRLLNYVDVNHAESIRWLEWAGFRLLTAVPFGPQGLPFYPFFKDT